MGITIVQKSDLSVRKPDAKVALVLAGGAVTGGAFKLGGLKALDDCLVSRKITEFDIYVGLSAGALLAAPLSAGVTPAEMLKSLEGKSAVISQFRALDFYRPNVEEFVERPLAYLLAVLLFVPRGALETMRGAQGLARELAKRLSAYWEAPQPWRLARVLEPLGDILRPRQSFPSPLDYLPTGLFDNRSIERYVRRNFERAGLPNDFRALYRRTGRALYISAMNLDTAERVVFGHDEEAAATISEAVQASTALPGFYRPARIRGVDYVDGGVRRTANIDVAIEHGAELVICYNPFRPFTNRVRRRFDRARNRWVYDGEPLAQGGLFTVLNQVFRTLLHSRLQYGLRQYQEDPGFQGDIIVIEPKESDFHFFELNALAYWQRLRAAQLGYLSVTDSVEENFDLIKPILARYGISLTRREVRQARARLRREAVAEATDVLTRELPQRRVRAV